MEVESQVAGCWSCTVGPISDTRYFGESVTYCSVYWGERTVHGMRLEVLIFKPGWAIVGETAHLWGFSPLSAK